MALGQKEDKTVDPNQKKVVKGINPISRKKGALLQTGNKAVECFTAGGEAEGKQNSADDLPGTEKTPLVPGPVSHKHKDKAVKKTEPVGDRVGEVEAVPNEIQLAQNKAQIQEGQKEDGAKLFPKADAAIK